MEKLIIEGGKPLKGEVTVSGSKNAALPILAATLLTDGECIINNVPRLRDTMTMVKLLESLGKSVEQDGHTLRVRSSGTVNTTAEYHLVSTMRGSFCVLGPLLGKWHDARVSLPGGCVIGVRPVDLHLKGLKALGAKIDVESGYVVAKARQLKGRQIYLGGVFGSSVLATANVAMAAVLAKGWTIIEYAACEPEIQDLVKFLRAIGADIQGEGTPRIVIRGVKELHGAEYTVGPDRIEAGTFMLLAAATRGQLTIRGAKYSHLLVLMDKLAEVGVKVKKDGDDLIVSTRQRLSPSGVTTYSYPGFPTDLQAQYMAMMCTVPGVSVITDKVFPDRFIHIAELNRMGAQIRREGSTAVVEGVRRLYGAPVMASDLRASAALVIAGLAAEGATEIQRIYHLDRGYEGIDEKLRHLGVRVERVSE